MEQMDQNPQRSIEGVAVSDWEDDNTGIIPDYQEGHPGYELLSKAEDGNCGAIKAIIKAHPEIINFKDGDGYTALHKACQCNFLEVAKFLIYNRADISAKSEEGWTPLHSAAHWDAVDCVNFLLQCGADVNSKSVGGSTPLHVASRSQKRDTAIVMLSHPSCDLSITNDAGDTAGDILRRNTKHDYLTHLAEKPFNVLKVEDTVP
ncbi:ankyrin repeat domain-containing protein 49-like [Artemia franciscana]|uniref:Ankyrin repeat domain-containing protein 49 n=1 Tax=Artemia franciscana TaxID=6661 RepID=A0AA88LKL4_ARTSF|nr:hypothetical protein QYM36_000048 [Artemia franciscana]KAK2725415.1 hypothetical protein QYM36_000048 [Artemia franciscana]